MRKTLFDRATGIIVAILTIALLVFVQIMLGGRERVQGLVVDENIWDEIRSGREETDSNLLSKLNFDGQDLIYEGVNDKWYYSVVDGDNMAYNPRVRYNSGVKLAVLKEGLSEEMVARNETRKVMAYTDGKYRIYNLVATTLPLMTINYDGDGEALEKTDNAEMKMRLFDNRKNATQRVTESTGDMHVRGVMASNFPKKSYKMNLTKDSIGGSKRSNNVSLLGMEQNNDWILYAGYNDQERVRNVFSSNLWKKSSAKNNSFGFINGSEYKYVELLVNGEYQGLYALGYKLDEEQANLVKDINGQYTEYLFKKSEWDYTTNDEQINREKSEKMLSGFELKSKTENEKEAWAFLEDYYDLFTDKEDINALRAMTDMRTANDIYLFLDMVQGSDHVHEDIGLKNVLITIKKKDGKKIAVYSPWDLDLTWGNMYDEDALNLTGQYIVNPDDDFVMKEGPVYRLLEMKDVNTGLEVKERYLQLRRNEWSDEAISRMLNEYEDDIFDSGAYARDVKKWPKSTKLENSGEKLSKFKEYVKERMKHLDIVNGLKKEESLPEIEETETEKEPNLPTEVTRGRL